MARSRRTPASSPRTRRGNGLPDGITFDVGPEFLTEVACVPDQLDCQLRFSVMGSQQPQQLVEDGILACASLVLQPGVAAGEEITVRFGDASAKDRLGARIPLSFSNQSFVVGDCCIADCNDDRRIDSEDAVSIVLELADGDGSSFSDTLGRVPFAGRSCCDANLDLRVDIADAVSTILGTGTLTCPKGTL